MYYKIINGVTVKSACKTLYIASEDRWTSNPTEEMIFAEGWQVWVPPIVPPQPELTPSFDETLEAVKMMLASETDALPDEDALAVAALFPTWASKLPDDPLNPKPEDTLPVGERLWYDGKLWKVIQAHTAASEWTPDTAVSLFVEVSIEEWPEWRQPVGSEDAYALGAHVSHNGSHWESTIPANVYEPGVYGWTEV